MNEELNLENIQTNESEVQSVAKAVSTREDVIERLKELAADISLAKRPELESLKQTFYKLQKVALEQQIAAFVEGGGTMEEFKPEMDPLEEQFRKLMTIIKEKKAASQEAMEAIRQDNLKEKQALLEQLRQMVENANTSDVPYSEFKAIVDRWKEIKEIPQSASNDLWKAFQSLTEKYYDIQKLNNEFREYDFKKNMEAKLAICEEAERLAEETDILAAFRALQQLHQDFRETGPVSKESREEIWNRFKAASTVINRRHQQHFEEIKKNEQDNLDQKTVICELIEGIDYDSLKTFQSWNDKTQEILTLQAKWKEIGFAPAKHNQKIFERYRTACDMFFSKKGEYFKEAKNGMNENLARKTALCEQAEALQDSTDWKETGDRLAQLQKEWREIGPVQKKYTASLWKRFIGACDHFYEARDKNTSSKRQEESANLARKKEILEKLKAFNPDSMSADDAAQAQALVAEWQTIGFVPFKMKEKMAVEYRSIMENLSAVIRPADRRRQNGQHQSGQRNSGTPRERMQRQLDNLKAEIQTYENNLGMISSKGSNSIVESIRLRVEALKEQAAELQQQIRNMPAEN
ncbi:MAG: DUF349 domain-containing protein [Bacteroidaceae bacterium]|nr:DUF349 domain-containing protein [Bacteroidaceae bacterium]